MAQYDVVQIDALNEAVTFPAVGGTMMVTTTTSAAWNGTFDFEGTRLQAPGSTDWFSLQAFNAPANVHARTDTTANTTKFWMIEEAGCTFVRVRISIYAAGTLDVSASTTDAVSSVHLQYPLPAGDAVIGQAKLDAIAVAHGANPTAVAGAATSQLKSNRAGILWTIGGHPNILTLRATYTAAQDDTALVTVSAGTKIVVTRVLVTVSDATTPSPSVIIGFAAANTPTTTSVVASHPGIPPGGGFSTGDGSGVLGVGGDGEDLRIDSAVATDGAIDVVISYFTIES